MFSEEGKKPLGSAWFLLVPNEQTKWTRNDLFLSGYTEKDGAFKVTGAPGEYILITQRPKAEPASFLEYIREQSGGPRVTLKPGEQSDVEIVVPVKN